MQNDYGDLVETPEHVRQIAHAVALAIREQERPFWISREQHHAQHMHLATLMDVAAADNVRRQWVDMQIQASTIRQIPAVYRRIAMVSGVISF